MTGGYCSLGRQCGPHIGKNPEDRWAAAAHESFQSTQGKKSFPDGLKLGMSRERHLLQVIEKQFIQ